MQSVVASKHGLLALGGDKRRTVAKATVDLALFAGAGAHPESTTLDVPLEPLE